MTRCTHREFRYISHRRGSQDGIACVKCRAFWRRTRCSLKFHEKGDHFNGSRLVRERSGGGR